MRKPLRESLAVVLAVLFFPSCRDQGPGVAPSPPANSVTSQPVTAAETPKEAAVSTQSTPAAQSGANEINIGGALGSRIFTDVSNVNPTLALYAPKKGYYASLYFYMDGDHSSTISGYGASGSSGLTFSAAAPNGRFNFLSKTRHTDIVYAATTHQVYSASVPESGFGSGHQVELESSSGSIRVASQINTLWTDASDETRTSALAFQTVSNAGPLTEQMRITGNGEIGIGTLNPTEKLHVVGNLRVEGSTDCTFGDGVASASCVSDGRLKSRVRTIKGALEKLDHINGVEFVWNEKSRVPGKASVGVIAQEVAKSFPTAVIRNSDGYLAVDYAALVAPLIQANKELRARGELSDQRIKLLENENASINTEHAAIKEELSALKTWLCSQKNKPKFCQ